MHLKQHTVDILLSNEISVFNRSLRQTLSRYNDEINAPTSNKNPLPARYVCEFWSMDVRRTERHTIWKHRRRNLRDAFNASRKPLPVNPPIFFFFFLAFTWSQCFQIIKKWKENMRSYFTVYLILKARGSGASSQLPEDISQRCLYFVDDPEGNTRASLHPGYLCFSTKHSYRKNQNKQKTSD